LPGLPDFVIIGAMKAGTTTLFRRLGQHPEIALPEVKEPHFFSWDQRWAKGQEWYHSLFESCDGITGEASASYSYAATADLVARRMSGVIPAARLIYSLRDPIERIRSHYRHQVIRARESRTFPEAVQGVDNEYVTASLYGEVVNAYLRHFDNEQLLIFRLEDLDIPASDTWATLLRHIGATEAEMPEDRHNISSETIQFTPAFRWLWDRGMVPSVRMPRPIRRIGKRLLTRDPGARSELLATSETPLNDEVRARLVEDQALLGRLTRSSRLAWDL
jgi:hypothetical protein